MEGGRCVDIDECARGLHDCHKDARCINIPGGYECEVLPEKEKGSGRLSIWRL